MADAKNKEELDETPDQTQEVQYDLPLEQQPSEMQTQHLETLSSNAGDGEDSGYKSEPSEELSSLFEEQSENPESAENLPPNLEESLLPLDEELTLEGQVEAILFSSPKPIKIQDILEILQEESSEDMGVKQIEFVVANLVKLYDERAGGFKLVHETGSGYQFQTVPAASRLMEKMFSSRPRPLSRAALETLSIIAYRQPSTRAEIEYIRGVDAGSIIKNLMERELIECVGRKDDAGRPMLFGTTNEFLKIFRIDSLADLPPLASFQPPPETSEASQFDPVQEVDVEEFVGDDSQDLSEVSTGLANDDAMLEADGVDADDLNMSKEHNDEFLSEDLAEATGPSDAKELEPEDSFEFEFEDDSGEVDGRNGAFYDHEETSAERDHGRSQTTEVDFSTGTSVEERGGKVDQGG